MRRIQLLCSFISALALASAPSLAFAEFDGSPTAESTGAQQTGAQDAISQAQQKLNSAKGTPKTAQQIKQAGDACKKALEAAKGACTEGSSPFIKQMAAALPGIISGVLSATGKDKCNQMAQGLDMLKNLQGDYNSDCGGKKNSCTTTCADSGSKVSQAVTSGCKQEAMQMSPTNPKPLEQACVPAAQANQQAISDAQGACNALQANQDAGKANKDALQQGQGNSQDCSADEAVDCSKTPDDPSCPKAINCNDPDTLKNNPQCACLASPRGCTGQENVMTNPNMGGDGSTSDIPSDGSLGSPDPAASGADGASHAGGAGSGLPGMPSDSGTGGKSGTGIDKDKNAKDKGVKTDVLGGDSPGGGMKYSGNSNPYDEGGKAALAAAVKKQAEDEKLKKQIGGSFGQTNWEKINNISKENGPRLIPDRR